MEASKYSQDLLKFIKQKEGFRAKAYICPGGFLTIGYGQRISESSKYAKKGATITEEEASKFVVKNVVLFYDKIKRDWSGFSGVKPCERDAFISLVYNTGFGFISKTNLYRKFKAGDIKGAAIEFLDIVKSNGKVLRGLVIRRREENYIFLNGWEAYYSAKSSGMFA